MDEAKPEERSEMEKAVGPPLMSPVDECQYRLLCATISAGRWS